MIRSLTPLAVACAVLAPVPGARALGTGTTYELTPADDWLSVLNGEGLSPGDTVILHGGTYLTPDTTTLDIAHVGTAADPIVIRAAKGEVPVLTRNTFGEYNHYYVLQHNVINMRGAQHVVLDGLEITGGNWGIRIGAKTDGQNITPTSPLGNIVRDAHHLTVQNCHIHHTHNTAVSANFPGEAYDALVFRGNDIHHSARWGESIYLGNYDVDLGGTVAIAKNCVIEGNYLHDNVWVNSWYQDPNAPTYHGTAVQMMDGCYNNVVRGNVMHYTRYPAVLISGAESSFGTQATPGWGPNVVEGNVVWQVSAAPQDISGQGMQIAADAVVTNNVIWAPQPFYISDHQTLAGNLTLANNTFLTHTSPFKATIEVEDPPSFAVTIANNALYRGQGKINVIAGNGAGSANILEFGNVAILNGPAAIGNPQNLDFFPIAGSPLLGAADAAYQASNDFNGTCRSGDLTVGAYVYDAAGNPGWPVQGGFKYTLPHGSPPADVFVCAGQSAGFATTATGEAPFTYQWRKDGVDIAGATSSSYLIASVAAGDAGCYACVVTDACGSGTTDEALLGVDDIAATDPASATRCPGAGVTFSTTASGTGPFAYQWKKDGLDIGGATASAHSIASVAMADEGDYTCAVSGTCGTVETGAATLVVDDPTTASDPSDETACPGDSVTFGTTAGGTGPFTYQWKKDGVDIGGATSSSHTINPVAEADEGAYAVAVTGACGMLETMAATLTVDEPVTATPPADQVACPGDSVTFSTTAGGTGPFTFQWRKDGVDIGGANASSHTIDPVAAADEGTYSVLVSGACGTTEPTATLTVDDSVTATDPLDAARCPGTSVTFSTLAGGTGPLSYQWKKDGVDIGGAGASSYTINPVASVDAGSYSVEVTGACGSLETAGALLTVDVPVTATQPADETACTGDPVTFATTAGGTGPHTYQWKKDGVDIGGASSSSYGIASVLPADAGVYSVLVTGACGSTEPSGTLTVDDPVTASDPLDQAICLGLNATFSTTAGGTGPFAYQWKKDGLDIGGATASSHTIVGVTAGDAGDYSVAVTGACGTLETAAATLTVGGSFVNYCTAGTSASGCNALISGSGTPSASAPTGFSLSATGVEGDKDGLFFLGTNGRQNNSWGSGTSFQCVVPPVIRGGLLTGVGTPGLCDNTISQDINALWTAKPPKNPGAGALVQAQLWYRDPFNTSNQTTSLSNAIEFAVCP